MASSRKPRSNDLAEHVSAILSKRLRPGSRLVLALSGGVDSVVLLDLLDALRHPLGFALSALHVNHRISRNAGQWAEFCAQLCAARGIPFQSVTVDVAAHSGESLEAAARAARYAVLLRADADFIMLAQHLDDQAETLLLQLLRGAGVKGLSAMPEMRAQDAPPLLLRPLLDVSRARIEAHAQEKQLRWVEDESNSDTGFARNFLRHRIFPLLESRFPAYRETLARAASHLAEAGELLDDLARLDAGNDLQDDIFRLQALGSLSEARAKNLLRHFLARQNLPMPGSARLGEILRQALTAAPDAQVCIALGEHELRRFGGALYAVRAADAARMPPLPWAGEERLELPHGTLLLPRACGAGVSLARLGLDKVTVRLRRGGEKLRPDCGRPCRTLKNLLQESRVPPWERMRLPLLFCGETPVWAPGIGVDCNYQTPPGEPGIAPEWRPA